MRNNILSFMIAVCVALSFTYSQHFINTRWDQGGVAHALPSKEEIGPQAKARRAASGKAALNPDTLLKLNGGEVLSMLKEPGLVRHDAPTVIWQYRDEACVLDIYFNSATRDVSQTPVAHYEIRSREQDVKANPARCAYRLVKAQGKVRMVDVSAIYKAQGE